MTTKSDPIITYNHMKEETAISGKYFRKTLSFKTQQTLLFIGEELLVITFLAAMIYLTLF